MGKCLLHAPCSDLYFVVTGKRGKEPGSAADADVNSGESPKDSVVRGLGLLEIRNGYVPGARGGSQTRLQLS